ncbi:MAG: hypothetical protein GY717_11185 [Rhodobacteraceae bacterium]|nr:hypothetical protein [Paracoccaceae bacterium]
MVDLLGLGDHTQLARKELRAATTIRANIPDLTHSKSITSSHFSSFWRLALPIKRVFRNQITPATTFLEAKHRVPVSRVQGAAVQFGEQPGQPLGNGVGDFSVDKPVRPLYAIR